MDLMQQKVYQLVANLYDNEGHPYLLKSLSQAQQNRFNLIQEGKAVKDWLNTLKELSQYLRNYHDHECIVLIDEYDHPLDVAFNNGFYDRACDMFATLFGALLKVSILDESDELY